MIGKFMIYRLLGVLCLGGFVGLSSISAQDKLVTEFAAPPDASRPHTWWHWMNGNISKEGITADLEAMKRVGIRGVTLFNVDQQCPAGSVTFLSEPWWNMTLFAVQEANRLGLTMGTANCPGWSSSGGPWITPEHGMKIVVTSEVVARGGGLISLTLPQPPTTLNFYRDIAVVAFPTPSAETVKMSEAAPKISASIPDFKWEALSDGDYKTRSTLPIPAKDKPQYIQWEFEQPYMVRSLTLLPANETDECGGEIQSSEDGVRFNTVGTFSVGRYLQPGVPGMLAWHRYAVKESTARFFRLVFTKSGLRWPTLSLAEVNLSPRLMINDLAGKAFFERVDQLQPMWSDIPADQVIDPQQIIDLTDRMNAQGKLNWESPSGDWTILRVGYTTIARNNHPAPAGGSGLEIDKLSREAAKVHWAAFMEKMAQKLGPLWGQTVNEVLIDSYEVGSQNWTPKMRAEFSKRRGYDLVTWLPTLTGRVVAGADQTDRFLWDFRRTVADLMAENYYDYFGEMARKSGVKLASEPYGNGPFEDLRAGRGADIIMGEFWAPDMSAIKPNLRMIASVAHTYGKQIAGAEALTSRSKWTDHPRYLKPCADTAFANGINYFELHRFVHQPLNRLPGLSLGPFGSHMERTNTWWEQSGGWIDYLARCQHMLRQGLFVADILYFAGEGTSPNAPKYMWNLPLSDGYNFDFVNADVVLNRLKVKDGRLVLPDGMSYRVLVLPPGKTMTPVLLRKLDELATAGAIIVGPKPEQSPSLVGYPGSDEVVNQLAGALWGAGKIREVKSLQEVFLSLQLPPDFEVKEKGARLTWTHRAVGGRDIYFLANGKDETLQTEVTFRVFGKVPELWDAETGKIIPVAAYEEIAGRIRVPLRFDPFGSLFVVFRPAPATEHPAALSRVEGVSNPASSFPDAQLGMTDGKVHLEAWVPGRYEVRFTEGRTAKTEVSAMPAPLDLTGPWELTFPPKLGASEKVTLEKLISWSDHPDSGVKYFSGTATYHKTFDVPPAMLGAGKKVYLDLGRVEVLAGVKVNGKDLGVLWKRPYTVEISSAVKPGKNDLEITATNLWPNRMIGDEQLPDDSPREKEWLKQWPAWVTDGKPSPTGRFTFTSWRFYKKDDALLPSGVLGPVMIRTSVLRPVSPAP